MTVTIELKPEIETRIAELAAAQGVTVEEYIECVLDHLANIDTPIASPEERLRLFDEWISSHSQYTAPRLPDEALSRESIYAEREDCQL
jgi:hypothetical protein